MRSARHRIGRSLGIWGPGNIARGLAAAVAAAAGLSTAVALSATAATAPATLPANGTLTAGQAITSPDGHFRVTMQSNGNLVESISSGRWLWSTGTRAHPGARAIMQVNGNLAVYDTANSAVWSSNSPTTGCPRLVLQDDGNLVIYTTKAIWSAKSRITGMVGGDVLQPHWSVYSMTPEDYRLTMQANGNLAVYNAAGNAVWTAGTKGHPGAYASMQTDGNFVVYSSTGHVLWSSATNGNSGAQLELLNTGKGSTVLWRSTNSRVGSGVSLAPRAPAPVTCPAPVSPAPTTTATVTVPTVVTVPVTTPVPQPPPRPRALRIRLKISWTWNDASTRLRRTKVGTFPGRTHLELRCRGRGCPRRSRLSATGIRDVHRLLRLVDGWHYRAGDRLFITLQAPRYVAQRAEIDIRWGREPRIKLLRA
jgi:hypothetical protein